MAGITGLLMVAKRSRLFPGCGRMKAVALLGGQPHLLPPEVAPGEKIIDVSHSIARASRLGAQGQLWAEEGVMVAEGRALLPSLPAGYGSGCIQAWVLWTSQNTISPTPHWVSNEMNDITVKVTITANSRWKSSAPNTCALCITFLNRGS